MSTNKHVETVAAVVMVIVIALTSAILYFSGSEELVVAWAYTPGTAYQKLFDQFEVMEIDITIDQGEWEDILENPTKEEYKTCDIAVNGKNYSNVAIRTKGNTSLSQVASSESDRYSFKVEFDHYDSGTSLEGLDKLVLNNIFSDASYLKEYISYDIFNYLGVAVPYYSFAHITVNGEEWGLYLALEAVEDSFVHRVYNTADGQLYKPESSMAGGGRGDMEMPERMERPEDSGFSDLEMPPQEMFPEEPFPNDAAEGKKEPGNAASDNGGPMRKGAGDMDFTGNGGGGSDLIYTDDDPDSYADIFDHAAFDLDETDKQAVIKALKKLSEGEDLETYFDVDACLRYFAAQTFIVNLDSYYSNLKHNYYLYEQDGQLTILPWDLNLAFGGFQASDAAAEVNAPIDTPMDGLEESRPLFSKLMEIEEYQERYHTYLKEIVTGYVGSGLFADTFDTVYAVIAPYVEKDATAFYEYSQFTQAVQMLKRFVNLRAQSVAGQLDGSIASTSERQKENSARIDASEIDLKTMGIQGGDAGNGKKEKTR